MWCRDNSGRRDGGKIRETLPAWVPVRVISDGGEGGVALVVGLVAGVVIGGEGIHLLLLLQVLVMVGRSINSSSTSRVAVKMGGKRHHRIGGSEISALAVAVGVRGEVRGKCARTDV